MNALKLEERTLAPQLNALRGKMLTSRILKDKPYWEDVLKEISHVIPPEIYLTYLEAGDEGLRLKGDILRGNQDSQVILSKFMLALEEGILQDVSLVRTRKKSGNASIAEFEITCIVE